MKLTEFAKNITEAMEICKKEKVDPEIWIDTDYQITEIESIKLEIGHTKNNKKVAYLTLIAEN